MPVMISYHTGQRYGTLLEKFPIVTEVGEKYKAVKTPVTLLCSAVSSVLMLAYILDETT